MSNRYLSPQFLAPIQQKIAAKLEPWSSAYQQLLTAADEALNQPPLSVRQNGNSPYFRQDAVYLPGKDGERNPASNRKSSELGRTLSDASLNLALAWRFTNEPRYADKALELIHAWCLNQDTFMFPTGYMFDAHTPGLGYGGDIVIFAVFQNMFLAGHLLDDYPGWNLPAHAAIKNWTRAMIEPQRRIMFYKGVQMYNNWEDARLLYLAKGALLLDDLDLLLEVFSRWREILPMKMTDEGELPRETERTKSMHYTLFALNSAAQVAEIAHHHGIDLYNLTINNRSLKKAIDYAAHYLLHMDQWPHPMLEPLHDERHHLAVFELACAHWPDPAYRQILDSLGHRPIPHSTLLFAKS